MKSFSTLLFRALFAPIALLLTAYPSQALDQNQEIQTIEALARNAPPEFGADALLNLVEFGLVADNNKQRALLLEAFDLGGSAQEPAALRRAFGSVNAGPVFVDAGIDRISLRARAVRGLLGIDPAKARELFRRIDLRLPVPSECEEISFDLSLYYAVFSQVLRSMPSRAMREELLEAHLDQIHSAAQVALFTRVVMGEPGTSVVPGFAAALPKLDPDRRTFTAEFESAMGQLAELAKTQRKDERTYLIEQTRAWVQKGMEHGLCGHRVLVFDSGQNLAPNPPSPSDPAQFFNRTIAPLGEALPLMDVRGSALPRLLAPRPADDARSPDYLRYQRIEQLLAQDGEQAQMTDRWQTEMEKYITLVENWTVGDPQRHYSEKVALFAQVLRMQRYYLPKPDNGSYLDLSQWLARQRAVPPAHLVGRDRLMLAVVDYFNSPEAASVYNTRRIVWFAPVTQVLYNDWKSTYPVRFHQLLASYSHHPVLNLYGHLEGLRMKTYISDGAPVAPRTGEGPAEKAR